MKQKTTKAIALACAMVCMGTTLVACGKKDVTDSSKTQLYVGNYDGGYGHAWLDQYKADFEALYANESFEEGKMGVEVVVLNDKVSYYGGNLQATMDQSNIDIIFTEGISYYEFINNAGGNLLYDMTSWVQETLPGESKSIEAKLNDQQKDYYSSVDGKYYGLPHFQSFRGLVYDVDLFNEKSLFIKADGSIAGKSTDADLSKGPDGLSGTYDDGMPATYDELWNWCAYVSSDAVGVIPFCWTGTYLDSYSKYLEDSLLVDALGREAGQFYFSPEGEVTVDLIRSFNGDTPVITSEKVSRENALDMSYAAAGYYMIDFWKHIMENNWYYNQSMGELTTHDVIHYDYLRSNANKTDDLKPIAFMIEGAWWENESGYIFDQLGINRADRNFGYMPFPKAREEYVGQKTTLLDANDGIMIVNANIAGKPEEAIAKKFVQYISTDASLQAFMNSTGINRDYQAEMNTDQLSAFSKQLWDMREAADGIVYARLNNHSTYLYTKANLSTVSFRESLTTDEEWLSLPVRVFHANDTKDVTTKEFFEGIARQYFE